MMTETQRRKKFAMSIVKNALREFSFGNYGLDDVDETKLDGEWIDDLATAIVEDLDP